ncbi:MAG: ATPase [Aigarchaeota archaeon]|nr:ATPase [Aigarchaeota archaeon]MDW8092855.1 ATPase [Nitrososphaerota archaeon]
MSMNERTLLVLLCLVSATTLLGLPSASAAEAAQDEQLVLSDLAAKVFAASIAFGLAALAAGIAISGAGSAGLAAATERFEMRTMALIALAFAESIAIYGIAVAFFILGV